MCHFRACEESDDAKSLAGLTGGCWGRLRTERRHPDSRGQPGQPRETAVGRATAPVVAGRRATVVGQRRIFVVIVADAAATTAAASAIVVEVEIDVRTVDAAAVGPAVVDEQRDGGRRQLVGADPAAVFPAADGRGPAALFRRVRFALFGHGPRDQYPGRSP